MNTPVETVAAGLLLSGLWMAGLTRIHTKLLLYGLQTVALGVLACLIGVRNHETALIVAGAAAAVLKGGAVPVFLSGVARRIGCRRDDGLVLAAPLVLLLTAAALIALVLLRPFGAELARSTDPAVGLVLIGMVLMVSRRLAISQIIGFLVLENGMFLYSVSQPHSMPLMVELGVLLDVLAGTMMAGMLVFRIRASFEHIDVSAMRSLRG